MLECSRETTRAQWKASLRAREFNEAIEGDVEAIEDGTLEEAIEDGTLEEAMKTGLSTRRSKTRLSTNAAMALEDANR